jgi:hypothetical protein
MLADASEKLSFDDNNQQSQYGQNHQAMRKILRFLLLPMAAKFAPNPQV